MWEALNELSSMSKVGVVVLVSCLATCVIGCGIIVYDSIRDTYKTIQQLRKNRKTKN